MQNTCVLTLEDILINSYTLQSYSYNELVKDTLRRKELKAIMEFESPDVAKEFPGLYLGESGKGKAMNNPVDFEEEGEKKKKKEKKDSKKDKGYAALAGESSHDEDETLDSKSPGKVKKLKTFKLSTKKKDKKSSGDKEKDRKSCEKELKKSEKDKKGHDKDKEKDKKTTEKDKEKDVHKSAEKDTIRPRRPFSGENLHVIKDANKTTALQGVSSAQGNIQSQISGPFESKDVPSSSGAVVSTLKEKTSALNAFLNAPAPIFTKKKLKDNKDGKVDKEHKDKKDKDKDKKGKEQKESKKDKDHAVSKVKLKLKRSKNSLEDSQAGDFPITTSHQFPEDPDSIAKEIRKYETLLEQTHTNIKGSKKVSKKQEEQLWELQRTLTQLKRKLRSVNALSSASSASIMIQNPVTAAHPIAKVSVEKEVIPQKVSTAEILPAKVHSEKQDHIESRKALKTEECDIANTVLPSNKDDDITLDFTLKTLSAKPISKSKSIEKSVPILSPPPKLDKTVEPVDVPAVAATVTATPKSSSVAQTSRLTARRSLDLSDLPNNNPISIIPIPEQKDDEDIKPESESPKQGLERVQVYVQVHHKEKSMSPEQINQSLEVDEDIEDTDIADGEVEIMENVVEDANKMIGSIHEELEAAAIVFGASEEFVSSTPKTAFSLTSRSHIPLVASNNCRRNSQGEDYVSTTVPRIFDLGPYEDDNKIIISKSEPTLGDRKKHRNRIELLDTSLEDYENDSDLEFLDESEISDPFTMPIFETEEYLSLENEALALFNEQIQEEIKKEEAEIQVLMQQLASMTKHGADTDTAGESVDLDEYNMDELIALWQLTKMENNTLNENVNGLQQLVTTNKLEQFQLETRLKYLEDRVTAISPLTMTTPLQTDV